MTDTRRSTVVVLDGSYPVPAALGGKGAALDRLVGWAVRVPPTAIVTADAYRATSSQPALTDLMARVAQGEQVTGDDVDAAFLGARLPTNLRAEIAAVARAIGDGRPLAIRSSATVEDLGGSSFAGQYRSVLDVPCDDADAVEQAVLRVFASLLHPAPRAYRDALGIDSSDIAMAAVIMQMVDTRTAGVVFTLDPTVRTPTIRVEVVDGLGESLVSGKRTPRVHQFRRTGDGLDTGGALLEPGLDEILTAALGIERLAGCPQDIEWAHDGARLWIVQARPVTALRGTDADPFDDDPASFADAEFTTEGIGEMLPGVLPPLLWRVAAHIVEEGFRTALDRLSADVSVASGPTWLIRRIHGRAALDITRLGVLVRNLPGADARVRTAYFLDTGAAGTPTGSARPSRREVLLHHRLAARARRRAVTDAEVVLHVAETLDRTSGTSDGCNLTLLDNPELRSRHEALIRIAVRALAAELTVSADAGALHSTLRTLLARYLDDGDAARWADRVTVPDAVRAVRRSESAAVFAGPTWDELRIEPAASPPVPDRGQTLDELEGALRGAPRWPAPGLRRRLAHRRLEHLADHASRQFLRREECKGAILLLGGEVRRIHREIGRRLVAEGRLVEPDDVSLLDTNEMWALLTHNSDPAPRDVERRRRTIASQRAGAPLPSRWRGLPPEGAPVAAAGSSILTGWPASGGRFIGRARRIDDPRSMIGRDEVLVAAATDPSWSPLLLRCGALVLERGGPLSHAAILAREFGLPAVFNIPGAADALDGKRVLVDGDAGTVTLLPEEPGA